MKKNDEQKDKSLEELKSELTFIEDDDIEFDIPTRYYKVTATKIED